MEDLKEIIKESLLDSLQRYIDKYPLELERGGDIDEEGNFYREDGYNIGSTVINFFDNDDNFLNDLLENENFLAEIRKYILNNLWIECEDYLERSVEDE